MNWPLAVAALLVAGGCGFHASLTTRWLAPLHASGLPPRLRWILALCWHFVSVVFAVIASAFAAGAAGWLGREAVLLDAVLAAAIAILCGVSAMKAGLVPWRHPASYVLGGAALLALLGG